MKKILFVIESLYCGGAEKSIVTLLQNIDLENYHIDLLLTTKGGEFEKFVPTKVNVVYEDILAEFNTFSLLIARLKYWIYRKKDNKSQHHSSQHFWKAFEKKIKFNNNYYDVAIAYGQGFPTYYIAEKVNANYKYAWLNTDHQKSGYNASFDYQMYTKFNKIITVSEESRLSLEKALKTIKKTLPIEIIKDISDKNFIESRSNEETPLINKVNLSETILLTVCRLEKVKGLNLALNACEILVEKGFNIKWYVIGEGSERSNLQRLITEKKLHNNFILLGFKENPYAYMKRSDIYVQTSLFEGLGLTVIEASILEKPIVTTNFPTASTILTHKKTGLICEMNGHSIAESIMTYLENETFTKSVIENLSETQNNDKEISLKSFNELINFKHV